MTVLLVLAVIFLAYANGANDNFKGVASLFGSRTTGYRTALTWATVATIAGSLASIFLAQTLLKRFSGKGIVPDALAGSDPFLLAVALGAGLTVILATRLGFPISTTHGLTGAIFGAGMTAAGGQVQFAVLGKQFILPLLLSPFVAVVLGATIYLVLRWTRLWLGIHKETCLCVGTEVHVSPIPQPATVLPAQPAVAMTAITARLDTEAVCSERYAGSRWGVNCQRLMDAAHFVSAGIVCFARGLNDTPKIAALLLILPALDIRLGLILVAVAMAIGGIIHSRRIAETMSHRITGMNHGQGFSANLATGLLVISASLFSLPVSTTHVSVGALCGIGATTRQADYRVIGGVILSWVLTLPCAALAAAVAYRLIAALE